MIIPADNKQQHNTVFVRVKVEYICTQNSIPTYPLGDRKLWTALLFANNHVKLHSLLAHRKVSTVVHVTASANMRPFNLWQNLRLNPQQGNSCA